MAQRLDKVNDYSSSEERQYTTMSNYRTISLTSHPSKVMLRVILNKLVNQAEQLLEEEQAGFRSQRSVTEYIFNLRLLVEKYWEHEKDLYHNFINFKKAFAGLWRVLN